MPDPDEKDVKDDNKTDDGDNKDGKDQSTGGSKDDGKEKPETYEVTVDGKTEHLTLDELLTNAGKVKGAEVKFAAAAEIRKDAAKGMRVLELAKQLRDSDGSPDIDVATEFFGNLGFKTENIPGFEKLVSGKDIMDGKEKGDEKGTETPAKVGMDNLDPEMKAIMQDAQQAKLEAVRKNIIENTKKGIDKDEILGKMVVEAPADKQAGLKQVLYDMAIEEVTNRIVARGEKFGPEMTRAVAQKMRSRIKNLGIPAKAAGHPPVVAPGQTLETDPAIYADKPIERVKVDAPNYIENVVARTMQRQYRASQETRKR